MISSFLESVFEWCIPSQWCCGITIVIVKVLITIIGIAQNVKMVRADEVVGKGKKYGQCFTVLPIL